MCGFSWQYINWILGMVLVPLLIFPLLHDKPLLLSSSYSHMEEEEEEDSLWENKYIMITAWIWWIIHVQVFLHFIMHVTLIEYSNYICCVSIVSYSSDNETSLLVTCSSNVYTSSYSVCLHVIINVTSISHTSYSHTHEYH